MSDLSSNLQSLSTYPVGTQPASAIEEVTVKAKRSDEEGFSFWDFLDVINPLQHIPVVNTIYREMTGDEIKPASKMIGSALIGGPIGLGVAMVDGIIEESTGKDLGGHTMAMFRDEEGDAPASNAASAVVSANSSVTTAAREFIPAAVTAAIASTSSAAAREFIPGAVSVPADATWFSVNQVDEEEAANTPPPPEETEAAIAAAAAAVPPGLVFMPLPGRQGSGEQNLSGPVRAQEFIPIAQTDRPSGSQPRRMDALDEVTTAQLRAKAATLGGAMGQSSSGNPILDVTTPTEPTGRMPSSDPFAAARLIAQESSTVAVPAWFDKAMMDAVDQYQAMQMAPRSAQ